MAVRLGVIVASVRQGRVGDTVGAWVVDQARERTDFEVDLIDLAQVDLPLRDVEPEHPARGVYTHPLTREWSRRVGACQAFVIVTPEYNHGYPAALKNAIDRLHREWAYRPVGFVSYGGAAGGVRAVQQLQQVVVSLRMVVVPDAVSAPYVGRQVDGDFLADEGQLVKMRKMLDELTRLTPLLRPLQEG